MCKQYDEQGQSEKQTEEGDTGQHDSRAGEGTKSGFRARTSDAKESRIARG